jgi:hypothetical protein
MFCVYVLENSRGKFYIGQPENIAQRLQDQVSQIFNRNSHPAVAISLGRAGVAIEVFAVIPSGRVSDTRGQFITN